MSEHLPLRERMRRTAALKDDPLVQEWAKEAQALESRLAEAERKARSFDLLVEHDAWQLRQFNGRPWNGHWVIWLDGYILADGATPLEAVENAGGKA